MEDMIQKIGLDTGFFVRLLEGNDLTIDTWKKTIAGSIWAVVSPLTFFELKRLSLKGVIDKDSIDTVINAIINICYVVWLDNLEIFELGASLSHGIGMPTVDSLILAGFISVEANKIFTTDSHFEAYKKKSVSIIKL